MPAIRVPVGTHHLLLRAVRGLESIAAAEARGRLQAHEVEVAHREVRFALADLTPEVLRLGTPDDAFIVLVDAASVGTRRADLVAVERFARAVDLDAVARLLARLRAIPSRTFDVSASFLGERTYSRFEIEDALGTALAASSGWSYLGRRAPMPSIGSLSLRVHLTTERTTVAVRVGHRPLHRRAYRTRTVRGALHPPVARALALLVRTGTGQVLLDPCSGSGTIPIEAATADPSAQLVALDIDPVAIRVSRKNGAALTSIRWGLADAGMLPLRASSVDGIVTNPPWGVQVASSGRLGSGGVGLWIEMARVLRPGGRVVLLLPPTERAPGGLRVLDRIPLRLLGRLAEILVLEA